MAKKKHIGELLSFKFTDKKELLNGVVIDHNDDWTLMKQCVDNSVDGFVIFKNKNIEGYRRAEGEKFAEKIIKLKGQMPTEQDRIPIDDIETILRYLTTVHKVFPFALTAEDAIYLGRLLSVDKRQLAIDFLDPRAKWVGKRVFRTSAVRQINFDNDYINSLKLVAKK